MNYNIKKNNTNNKNLNYFFIEGMQIIIKKIPGKKIHTFEVDS